jgi:RHS repeat-associated protein
MSIRLWALCNFSTSNIKKMKNIFHTLFLRKRNTLLYVCFLIIHTGYSQYQEKLILNQNSLYNINGSYLNLKAGRSITLLPGFKSEAYTYNKMMATIFENNIPLSTPSSLNTSTTLQRTLNTALPVGSIPASHSVSLTGAATYNIPIQIPPGTSNVMPNLSVSYSSQSGSGLLGYGWNLSSHSIITRTGKDVYHNNETADLTLTETDFLSLDGNRLILSTGTYGADGSTYVTESETFSKVTINGTGINRWYKVESKNGITMEFGNTEDSKFYIVSGQILTWRITKMYDNYTNYVNFKYRTVSNECLIDEILYTGNTTTGQLPYNSIKFRYEERLDANKNYVAGGVMESKHLISKINITVDGGQSFKSYEFKYGNNNLYSFLNEVTEYGSDGTNLNSTLFKYGDEIVNTTVPQEMVTLPELTLSDIFTGDFNGDGLTDLLLAKRDVVNENGVDVVYHNRFRIYRRLNTFPTQFETTHCFEQLLTGLKVKLLGRTNTPLYSNFQSRDFDGDSREDILMVYLTTIGAAANVLQKVTILKPNNDATQFTEVIYNPPLANSQVGNTNKFLQIGDFDGDGNSDFMTFIPNSQRVYLNFPSRNIVDRLLVNETVTATFNPTTILQLGNFSIIDFDGDGKQELLVTYPNKIEVYAFIKVNNVGDTKVVKIYETPNYSSDLYSFYFGDFNKDGKTDILTQKKGTNQVPLNDWSILHSTGKEYINAGAFTFANSGFYPNVSVDKVIVSDFNGDGFSDILYLRVVTGLDPEQYNLYYGNGTSFKYELQTITQNFIAANVPYIIGDFNGDGRTDIGNYINGNNGVLNLRLWSFKAAISEAQTREYLLEEALDGSNKNVRFSYSRLTAGSNVYTKGTAVVSDPLSITQVPMKVVIKSQTPSAVGGFDIMTYKYEGARLHRSGKGFLGFSKVEQTNLSTGIKSISEADVNTTFFINIPKKQSTVLVSTGAVLSEATQTITVVDKGNKQFFLRNDATTETNYLSGATSTTSNTIYDSYGNVTKSVANIGNGLETVTTDVVYGTFGTYIPASPTSTTVTKTRSGSPSVIVKTERTFNALGAILTEKAFADKPEFVLTEYLNYNSFGRPLSSRVSSLNLPTRTSSVTYDTKGRFIVTSTSPLVQTSYQTLDSRWGKPLREVSVDLLITTNEYDGYGRIKRTVVPEGYSIYTNYVWDIKTGNGTNQTDVDNSIFYTEVKHPGRPDAKTWYDIKGRVRKQQTEGYNGALVNTVTTYDGKGNVKTKTSPFYDGQTPVITTNTYAIDSRPSSVTKSENSAGATNYTYTILNGNQLTIRVDMPAPGRYNIKTMDASNKIVASTDVGGTVNFAYDSWGNQTVTTVGGTILATKTYDTNYGRQTSLVDKNAGTTTYTYNAYGELKTQVDALGATHTVNYDVVGRITNRVGPEGTTTYEYGNISNNKVKKITAFSGAIKEFTYDQFRRPTMVKETIDGTIYSTTNDYDVYGNATTITYSSGVRIGRVYDANGFLQSISELNDNKQLFSTISMNAFGQYTQYRSGVFSTIKTYDQYGYPTNFKTGLAVNMTNTYQDLSFNFDIASGNLNSRTDNMIAKTETFLYDNLNRLRQTQLAPANPLLIDYDTKGNITSKYDVGTYNYDLNRIHAVSDVNNTGSNISLLQQDISYTGFHQPNVVTENNFNLTYTYGDDYERIKSVLKQGATTVVNTRYYTNGFEVNIDAGATPQYIHYLGGDGLNVVLVRQNNVNNYNYVHTDYLGSILKAMTVISINSGSSVITTVASQSFDAWGRKRNPTDWTYNNIPTVPNWMYRGYTGHEDLQKFALVNMNGRIYDPTLGRMLSPDNYTHEGTQGYNRYAYVYDNPLKYTDPSGDVPFLFIALVGAVINLTANSEAVAKGDGWTFFGYAAIGAASSLASAGVGAGIGSLLGTTGFIAGAASGAGGGFTSGFIAGTGNAVMQGSNDPLGAGLKGGIGAALLGGVIGGVVGGIDAATSDRNFWTGNANQYDIAPALTAQNGGDAATQYQYDSRTSSNPGMTAANTGEKYSYYKPENGVYGITNRINPGKYIKVPIDGVTSWKYTDMVFKVPTGSSVVIMKHGNVYYSSRTILGGITSELKSGRYGWVSQSAFTPDELVGSPYFYEPLIKKFHGRGIFEWIPNPARAPEHDGWYILFNLAKRGGN